MKYVVLGIVAAVLSQQAIAQEPMDQLHSLCGTDLMRQRLIAQDPDYLVREAAYEADVQRLILENAQWRDEELVVTIPIVFHILHLNGQENIPDANILNQVEILNKDFRKLNTDITQVHPAFQGIAADCRIEFALPTKDGFGNCHNGIDRIQSVGTLVGEDRFKRNQWPRDQYLNVWISRSMRDGVAGFAYYPEATTGFFEVFDGVMILSSYIGSLSPSNANSSRALTHEIGHYLNLQHVWGNNNGEENVPAPHMGLSCGDDGVADTPFTKGWNQCRPANEWAVCDRQSFRDLVNYGFHAVTTSSGTTDPTPVPNAIDSIDGGVRVQLAAFTSVGVSADPTSEGAFSFNGWGVGAADGELDLANLQGAINTGSYYQFAASPVVTHSLSLNSFTFALNRSATGPRTFAVRSSVDNYANNLPVIVINDTLLAVQPGNILFYKQDTTIQRTLITIDPVANGYTNVTTPITFRIYAWNAEDADGVFELDDVRVDGRFGRFENVQNYMEYSYCSRMFTAGQSERMRAVLENTTAERSTLWSEANLVATGVTPGSEATCPPQADLYARLTANPTSANFPFTPTTCTNANVLFFDNSSRAIATSWEWTFQDGTPATSTQRDPTVQFSSPGWRIVTLTATNAYGSTTKTDQYAVLVGNNSDAYQGVYGEGFEGNGLFPWFDSNYDRNHTRWQQHIGGGAMGTNRCARLNSGTRNQLDVINPTNASDIDDLVSPLINLSSLSSATLSFWYSYSTQTTTLDNVTEKLEVFSSTDCGRTWQSRASITGAALVNGGTASGPGPWTVRNITLPGSVLTQNVRFRFRYTSSEFSGDLFIDEIGIGAPVGIDDMAGLGMVRVFPNPSNDLFNIHVAGMETLPTELQIQDLRGALVHSSLHSPMGGQGIVISSSELGLAEGMYILSVKNDLGKGAQKLIVGQ